MNLRHKAAGVLALWRGMPRIRAHMPMSYLALATSYRRFRWATGASPQEYLCYRMWDDAMPIEDRVAFITWVHRRPLEAFMNAKAAADVVRSKVKVEDLFREAGIPAPPMLGVWFPDGVAGDHPKAIRSREVLVERLAGTSGGVVCKREYGGSGKFVRVFTAATGDWLDHASGERWSIERLIADMRGTQPWLVQQRMRSHPDIAHLIGRDELATIRFVTYRRKDDRIGMIPTMLRLPATKSGLDNLSAGNVAVFVHADGTLGNAISGLLGRHISAHPLSGIPFAGFRVPHWEESAAMVRNAHLKMPVELSSLGWDVALSSEGPVMLETNDWWGDASQQPGPRGLLDQEFLAYVEERGGSHLLQLDRRQRLVEEHHAASRAAKSITSP